MIKVVHKLLTLFVHFRRSRNLTRGAHKIEALGQKRFMFRSKVWIKASNLFTIIFILYKINSRKGKYDLINFLICLFIKLGRNLFKYIEFEKAVKFCTV